MKLPIFTSIHSPTHPTFPKPITTSQGRISQANRAITQTCRLPLSHLLSSHTCLSRFLAIAQDACPVLWPVAQDACPVGRSYMPVPFSGRSRTCLSRFLAVAHTCLSCFLADRATCLSRFIAQDACPVLADRARCLSRFLADRAHACPFSGRSRIDACPVCWLIANRCLSCLLRASARYACPVSVVCQCGAGARGVWLVSFEPPRLDGIAGCGAAFFGFAGN